MSMEPEQTPLNGKQIERLPPFNRDRRQESGLDDSAFSAND